MSTIIFETEEKASKLAPSTAPPWGTGGGKAPRARGVGGQPAKGRGTHRRHIAVWRAAQKNMTAKFVQRAVQRERSRIVRAANCAKNIFCKPARVSSCAGE